MADISQVKLPNGDTYNLVDETSGYIKNYTETDPVFSASAAAGITSADISNWNGKSSTDEKVKQTPLNGTNSTKGLLFSSATGSAETTNTIYTSNKLQWNDNACSLYVYNADNTKNSNLTFNSLRLSNSSTAYSGLLKTANVTAGRTYTLPDKDGIIALTSDIPSVYSSTNTGGYLTMATLPIYDGTVEQI